MSRIIYHWTDHSKNTSRRSWESSARSGCSSWRGRLLLVDYTSKEESAYKRRKDTMSWSPNSTRNGTSPGYGSTETNPNHSHMSRKMKLELRVLGLTETNQDTYLARFEESHYKDGSWNSITTFRRGTQEEFTSFWTRLVESVKVHSVPTWLSSKERSSSPKRAKRRTICHNTSAAELEKEQKDSYSCSTSQDPWSPKAGESGYQS